MKQFLRDYFTFNRRERNGVFILISIILLLIFYLSFSNLFFTKEKTDFSKFEKEIAEFESEQKQISDSLSARNNYFTYSSILETDSAERFPFNPNNLPDEDWLRLGLSEKQINVIKNYEAKGGKFRTKEDVKKMYCIAPELYASLETYIRIPKEGKTETLNFQSQTNSKTTSEKLLIELNAADTTELKKLDGIGSAYAKRIVKYRDLIGGFVRKEQLLEVYGLTKKNLI